MISLFKRKNKPIIVPDFKAGQIYKMNVASRSHVRSPYYVEILKVKPEFIITNIPEYHDLKIEKGKNWDYHIPRMEYVGEKSTHGHLILNQKFQLP